MRSFSGCVMDTVKGIELTESAAPSHILRDLFEYATLAFIGHALPTVQGKRRDFRGRGRRGGIIRVRRPDQI
ncbi:hypothetical protein BJV74DRAFT_833729 [Russula compacta]|nr:hypothetical protein BJV74DRAFT_833729 [Russula compacta]